jgi:hypothetical protein
VKRSTRDRTNPLENHVQLPDIGLGKQVGCLGNIWRDFVKRVLGRKHLIIYSKADRDKVAILAVYLGVEAWPQVQHISPSGVARERRRPFRGARCFDQGAECGRRARLKWSSPKILAKHKGERSLYYCPRRIKRSRKILSSRFGMVVARDGGGRVLDQTLILRAIHCTHSSPRSCG